MTDTSILIIVTAALSSGFLGSPHCLGMCGGIVTAFGLSMQTLSPARQRLLVLMYHLGRLLSYSTLGLVAAALGKTVLLGGTPESFPWTALGVVLILIGLGMLGVGLFSPLERLGAMVWRSFAPIRQKLFPLMTVPRALAAGLLWGLLPCGLVYGALLLAATSPTVSGGALAMFAFGLGTLPMLLLTAVFAQRMHTFLSRWHFRSINGVLLILAGVWLLSPLVLHGTNHHGQHSHNHAMQQKTGSDQTLPHHMNDSTHESMDKSMDPTMDMPEDHRLHTGMPQDSTHH